MKVFVPGFQYYVDRVKAGPFSLIQYGEGEWKKMAGLPLTAWQKIVFSKEDQCNILRHTVTHCYRDRCYLMTTGPLKPLRKAGYGKRLLAWAKENVPSWVQWHDGHVFRRAARRGQLYPLVEAILQQPLPFVVVGPPVLSGLPAAAHIVTSPEEGYPKAWYGREETKEEILAFGKPAFFSFSIGTAAKVLIHELFPIIGEHSYLIDFGSLWEGLCGSNIRPYHKHLTPALAYRNLTGGD